MEENASIQTFQQPPDSILGAGVPVTNFEEFYWLEGGYFLVQTYETTFGNEPAQKGLNYWFYDSETKRWPFPFSIRARR
jgi:hypothetical protein